MPASPFDVQLRNKVRSARIPEASVKAVCRKILRALGFKQADLSVLLVGDREIKKLNRLYLRKDRPTDVMAFGQPAEVRPHAARFFLGDVVISLAATRRQAKEYGNDFYYELCFYLCHGILHLTGYRDVTREEAERMLRKQARILEEIGIRKGVRGKK